MQTVEDFQLKVAELKNTCLLKKNTFQPVIAIVGTLESVVACYIVINNISYLVTDYMRAVDVAFKSFDALNCCYPSACQPVWTFIQKFIYNIDSPYDKNYSSVNKLIEQLNSINLIE